ncbi:Hypothetical predicted protein [Pelobates cultripes]|uniref:Uncharacterized protein n=1 Tax=Pelobates cultripes TaxID=61616 RepID=A0AAD1VKP0_PELCU|nr:Hypothetical predicted protein [Pelobates cultripes]
MVPPKSQRQHEFFKTNKREKGRPDHGGGGSAISPSHHSEVGSDSDSTQILGETVEDLSLTAKRLADMLSTLRTSLQLDFRKISEEIRKELGTRTSTLEEKMDELCENNNKMREKLNKMEADYQQLQEKMADIEDRSRCNNIRVRNVPEKVQGQIFHFT